MAQSSSGISNRGWNDPPKVPITSESQSSKKQLTQRVGHILPEERSNGPVKGDDGKVKQDVLPLSALRPNLPANFAPPPTSAAIHGSEKQGSSSTMAEEEGKTDVEISEDEVIITIEEVLSRLQSTLEECKHKMRPRVIDDIKKKFTILEKAWSEGKLSFEVQSQLSKLSTAISERRYVEADRIHLNLMMEYINQVSSWMVGLKRLLSEAKTILPAETDPASGNQDSDQPKQQIPFLLPVNS